MREHSYGGIFNTRYSEAAQFAQAHGGDWPFRTADICERRRSLVADQSYYDASAWKGTWALDGGGARS